MTMETDSDTDNKPYKVHLEGDLPYYLPFPEEVILTPSLIGAEPFQLRVQHFTPPTPENGMHGFNVDDRLGTFIRSRIILEYRSKEWPLELNTDVLRKALSITNRLIDAIKYMMSDFSMRPIFQFDHFTIAYIREGSKEIPSTEGNLFGPFGVKIRAVMPIEAAQRARDIFNGTTLINPARMLTLDAKYHIVMEDYNRAILDLGTALEIHIGWLINQYKFVSPEFSSISTEDKDCWRHYDEVLLATTGHTMREEEGLFIQLEYIRGIRNSVTHEWNPIFKIGPKFKSRYLEKHRAKEGIVIDSKEKALELAISVQEILDYAEDLFKTRCANKSN
ncbi:MAG: hypothetical protein WA109_01205 [Bellilinea sp.]